tara:strand:+ start:340 stop:1185 length:846 start_codon:yes stop_codon:yes gene_type:complete
MSDNPLKSYVRTPKLQVLLPSRGKWGDAETASKITGEIPVYPMTSKDEVMIKNPDALLNGESVASVLKSCTGIENIYDLTNNDVEFLLVAIRYATSGNEMEIDASCPNDQHVNRVAVDLERILDSVEEMDKTYQTKLENGLKVNLRPMSFKNAQRLSLNAFQEATTLQTINDAKLPQTERIKVFNKSFEAIADLAVETMIDAIVSVVVPEGDEEKTVTDKKFIGEWVKGMSSAEAKKIQEKLDEMNKEGFDHSYNVVCEECGTKFKTSIEFNVSNFFGTGS